MNLVTIGIGSIALIYGLLTIFIRVKNPSKMSKLVAMKEKFGEKTGIAVHVVAYTIVPICFGLYFIYLGYIGISFF